MEVPSEAHTLLALRTSILVHRPTFPHKHMRAVQQDQAFVAVEGVEVMRTVPPIHPLLHIATWVTLYVTLPGTLPFGNTFPSPLGCYRLVTLSRACFSSPGCRRRTAGYTTLILILPLEVFMVPRQSRKPLGLYEMRRSIPVAVKQSGHRVGSTSSHSECKKVHRYRYTRIACQSQVEAGSKLAVWYIPRGRCEAAFAPVKHRTYICGVSHHTTMLLVQQIFVLQWRIRVVVRGQHTGRPSPSAGVNGLDFPLKSVTQSSSYDCADASSFGHCARCRSSNARVA